MMHPEGAWQLRAMIANAGLASLRPRRCTSDGASASAAMRSARRHMGWLPASFIGIAFVAACWHAGGERLFLSASQKTGSLRAPPTHGVRAEDIKVVRSSSMNYLALCATALSAAVLVRRSPPKSRPRVRIQACQTCATPSMQACTTLPISIDSMDFLGSSEALPEIGEAVTEVPPVILPADVGSFAKGAVVPEKHRAGYHDGQRAKDRNYRRQVGSRLLAPLGAVPLALSFDPSRVRLKLQRAVQHRFATSATGREGKARSRSEGRCNEGGLQTFTINSMARSYLHRQKR
eukprot:s899_g17.t1